MSEPSPFEVSVKVKDLAEYHARLRKALMPDRSGGRSGHSAPGPRLPVRVDVLDVLLSLEQLTLVWFVSVVGTKPTARTPDVQSMLLAIEDELRVWPVDERPEWFASMLHQIATHHDRIQMVLDVTQKPMVVRLPCPFCRRYLTVHRDRGVISCHNFNCRCGVEDCGCVHGRGHKWKEAEWPMLGLLIGTTPDG
ncbi:hypothetical protein UFOVP1616_37 [uncultured Caudovirales phage]|uniref:Uncharacterized protein n=1 Tax=uncultured Caudovirales phage TaxID=2100421 RepID=A0A6J5SXF0_9CAUD|nr:hypothetical protein UFOVP1467_53 [uncultured Caudovirales phage]CAB4219656.1 hypothetical protein UFOVP1616_37 [uncultured Caudovirales phage]